MPRRRFASSARAIVITLLASLAATCRVAGPPGLPRPAPSAPPPSVRSGYAPSQPAGILAGMFAVDGSGTATFELPITAPPGTAGVQPDLALTYNHHRENGYLGMGWQLSGLSAIGRCVADYAQDGFKSGVNFDARDRFCIDGLRLIAIRGAYGADGTVYHTATDTQTSVLSHGTCGSGPCSFSAFNKSGERLSFGATASSRIRAHGRTDGTVRTWAIDRHTDLNGNYTAVTYTNDDLASGEYVPVRIDYTGNEAAGLVPQRSVALRYRQRPDKVRRYMGGSLIQATQLLDSIVTSVTGETAQTIRLGYETSAFTQRSRLVSATICDGADVCLPPVRLAWQTESGDFADAKTKLPGPLYVITNGRTVPLGVLQDFNGDGIADYSVATEFVGRTTRRDLAIWLGKPDGSFAKASFTLPGPIFRATSTVVVHAGVLQDLDGDAILDFSPATHNAATGKSDLSVYLGTGSGFGKASWTLPDAMFLLANGRTVQTGVLADMNGDGIPDYSRATRLLSTGQQLLAIFKGTGNGYAATGTTLPGPLFGVGTTAFARLGVLEDIDGDGIADYSPATFNARTGVSDLTVWTGVTPGFTFAKSFDLPGPLLTLSNGQSLDTGLLIDLNGDGIPDYSRATDILTTGKQLRDVYLGTGKGFADSGFDLPGPVFLLSTDRSEISGVLTQLNGDGTSRYARATQFPDGRQDLAVHLGSGNGFRPASFALPQPLFQIASGGVFPRGVYEDLNGDGITDFADAACTLAPDGTFANCNLGVRLAKGPFSDLVSTITSTFGGTTRISYQPISDPAVYSRGDVTPKYPVRDAQGPVYVVSRYAIDDRRGSSYTFGYRYSAGRTDVLGRGFLGFTNVVATEQAGGRTSETTYAMTFPFYGLATHAAMRDGDGALLESTDTTYTDIAPAEHRARGVHQPLRTGFVDTMYQDGAPAYSYARDYAYDAFGNMTLETEHGDEATGVLPVHHCVRYFNDSTPDVNRLGYPLQKKSTRTLAACRALLDAPSGEAVRWDPVADLRWSRTTYDSRLNTHSEESYDDSHSVFIPLHYTVDAFGNTLTITNAAGDTSTYTYDPVFHTFLESYTSPEMEHPGGEKYTLSTKYDSEPRFGIVVRAVDPNGNVMRQDVDGFGRPVAQFGPNPDGVLTQLVSMLWKTDGALPYMETLTRPSFDAPDDPETWYRMRERYDGLGRQYRVERNGLKENRPATIVSEVFFDAQARIDRRAVNHFEGDPVPIITTRFDALNRPVLTVDPSGVKERIAYTAGGLRIARTLAFDSPAATTAIVELDTEGRTRKRVEANGQTLTFGYDPLGQLVTRATAPESRPATLTFDSMGRLRRIARADTGPTTWTFDPQNRLRGIADASGNTIAFDAYDALQRPLRRTARYGGQTAVWSYVYDETRYRNGLSHPTTVTLQAPLLGTAVYHYSWDAYDDAIAGQLTLRGSTYDFATTRDPLGRPVAQMFPDGSVATMIYGRDENLSRVDVAEPGGASIPYAHLTNYTAMEQLQDLTLDANGVKVARRYYAPEVAFGKLQSIDAVSTKQAGRQLVALTYSWNELGEVTAIDDRRDPAQSQRFGYRDQPLNEGMGFLTSATGGYGRKSFRYEQLGNVVQQDATTFTYEPDTSRIAGSSAGTSWTFDPNGFLRTRAAGDTEAHYSFDADGNLVSIAAGDAVTLEAAYDHTGRKLIERRGAGPTVSWITDSYEVDDFGGGRMQHTRYIAGLEGPLAAITAPGDGRSGLAAASQRHRIRAMAAGRTTIAGRARGAMHDVLAFILAPRTLRIAGAALLALLAAAAFGLMLWPSFGRERTRFSRRSPLFARVAPLLALCMLLASAGPAYADLTPGPNGAGIPANGRIFFVRNLVDSVVSATDDQGRETASVAYEPYGSLDQTSSRGVDDFRPKFSGRDFDPGNQLYDFLARRYDPQLGRFISPDPSNQFVSPYLYAESDPASRVDPDGEFAIFIAVAVGAVAGAYFGGVSVNQSFNPLDWNWQSGDTFAGLFGGAALGAVGAAAGGAFVQAGVAVGSLGGTTAQIAGVAIGIAGEALVGAGENAAFAALGGATGDEILQSAAEGAFFGAVFGGAAEAIDLVGKRLSRATDTALGEASGPDAGTAFEKIVPRNAEAPCACGCSSFVAGTTVATAGGDSRPIEQLAAGDAVTGRDPLRGTTATGRVAERVSRTTRDLVRLTMAGGERLDVTPEHPFYADRAGWIAAEHLIAGDTLATAAGTPVRVASIERVRTEEPVAVYNLVVDGTESYHVGDAQITVHNGKYCTASITAGGIVTETWSNTELKKRFPNKSQLDAIKRDIRAKAANANKIVLGGTIKAFTRVKNPVKTASKQWVRHAYAKKFGANAKVPSSIRQALQAIRPRPFKQDVDEFLTRIQGGLTIVQGAPQNQGPISSFVNSTSGAAMGALSRAGPPKRIRRFAIRFV
ncbi:MAG TPA: polymorphic toxin-type HINT domain-containing protein [Thermoanaerobaculia bacterium]